MKVFMKNKERLSWLHGHQSAVKSAIAFVKDRPEMSSDELVLAMAEWLHVEANRLAREELAEQQSPTGQDCSKKERGNLRKLTASTVRAARAVYWDFPVTWSDLGRAFGVSRKTIRHAVIRKSWSHT